MTRGIRNNNPGNIRKTKGAAWRGMRSEQTDKDFLQFESMLMGLRAMCLLLIMYWDLHKLRTIKAMISRWAPESENNLRAYINFVSQRTGIPAEQEISLREIEPIAKAMCQLESNYTPDDELLHKAMLLACNNSKI